MPTKKNLQPQPSEGTQAKTSNNDDIVSKNIFAILGLSDLPEDQKAKMLQKMLQIIYQRVVARIMDVLPEDALRNLKRAIDVQDEKIATALLTQHGMMSFPELMAEEAIFIKYEMDAVLKGDAVLAK